MEKILGRRLSDYDIFLITTCLGCGLITICSFIKIPFFPVSFTLQTFAVFILALSQSPKQAAASIVFYLVCATIGLPVFGGKANPFWVVGKCGGYLIAFPLSAYLTSKLVQKQSPLIAVFCGQCVIYLLGWLWLVPLFGMWTAFVKGILIFIPSDIMKNLLAIQLTSFWRKGEKK